jgi:shikimate dehydrogenase
VHNGGFAAVGHNGVYLPLPVPVEYEHFKATMGALLGSRSLGFAGASVTVPHKEHLVRFVRESGGSIDELSERCGAANTLIVRNGGAVECMNSDGPALVAALCAGMAIEPAALRDLRVAVLGAGGAGRAAAAALARHGATIVLFNRTRHRAEAAARALSGQPCEGGGTTRVVVGRGEALGCGCFPVIVNATAVGLRGGPAPDASPLDVLAGSSVALDRTAVVLETVYAPRRTPLVAQAEAAGARTIRGDEMFLRQAALQFERWTGCPAPMELFRRFVASAP